MEVTALIHDCSAEAETGFAATCVEFPEANGQGETVEACIENLRGAIRDLLAYRKEAATKALLAGERLEVVSA
jgi:predicted RNase H-like HicB family nuclease